MSGSLSSNSTTEPLKPRRRFRFSLRTVFILVTLLGMALAWLVVQVKWMSDRRYALRYSEHAGDVLPATAVAGPRLGPTPPAPWSIRILGEKGRRAICVVRDSKDMTDAQFEAKVERIQRLFPEAEIVPEKSVSLDMLPKEVRARVVPRRP